MPSPRSAFPPPYCRCNLLLHFATPDWTSCSRTVQVGVLDWLVLTKVDILISTGTTYPMSAHYLTGLFVFGTRGLCVWLFTTCNASAVSKASCLFYLLLTPNNTLPSSGGVSYRQDRSVRWQPHIKDTPERWRQSPLPPFSISCHQDCP